MASVESPPTGASLGLTTCHVCSRLNRVPPENPGQPLECGRCGSPIHLRRPDSLARTSACLLSAAVLYIPANLLPVMHTSSILGAEDDTILSGVMVLVNTGSWPLAILVFFASIFVPILKLLALGLLVITTWRGSVWAPLQRTRLYRAIELVGRWSMLDIFVITVLVALVQFQTLATIAPGGGALAFASVVVLTMVAAQSFDPKLMWENIGERNG